LSNFKYDDLRIIDELNYFNSKTEKKKSITDKETIEYKNQKIVFIKKILFKEQISIVLPAELDEESLYNEVKCNMPGFHISFDLTLYQVEHGFSLEGFIKSQFNQHVINNKMCKQLKEDFEKNETNIKASFSYREISKVQNRFHIFIFHDDILKNKMILCKMSCDNCDLDFWEDIFIQIGDSINILTWI